MNAAPDVLPVLRKLRRRFIAQQLVRELGRVLLLAANYCLLQYAFLRWPPGPWLWIAAGIWVGLVIGAAVTTCSVRPSLAEFAARLDRWGGTHDRLTTALAFSRKAALPMQQMAQRECAAYLASRDLRPLLPWRFPREYAWLFVPAIALSLLTWDLRLADGTRTQLAAQARERTSPTVEALRALARELEQQAAKTEDPELKKLAGEIARRAEALRQTPDPKLAEHARLGQLSALEQLAQELQMQRKRALSEEELHALAAALQQAQATRKAAEQLKVGDRAGAADELERTAKKAEAEGEGSEAANAEAALRQALERLAQQQQLSPNAQSQLTPGQQSALQRLADALRQMPPAQGAPQNRQQSQGAQQSLNNLLTALQNMKFGDGKPGPQSPDAKDQPSSRTMQMAPSTAETKSGQSVDLPGASPKAGEKDTGTTDTPFGHEQERTKKGAELALSGSQAEQGASYTQALPGGLDASRTSRAYRELYDAMAPEAENAVLQEDIPLGSRLFIKRYFESIRPTQ